MTWESNYVRDPTFVTGQSNTGKPSKHMHDKNAFQYDAYRPLQWPSLGGGYVCFGGCLLLGGVCSGGGVSQLALRQTPPPPVWTDTRL